MEMTMRILRSSTVILAVVLSFPALPGTAGPTPGIEKLLSTPASAFDVFLHQIYVAANGPTFFGGSSMNEPMRIFDLEYDYGSNLLTLKFHIRAQHKLMKGFTGQPIEAKKDMLVRAARDLAESLGVERRDGTIRVGLLQTIPVRHGWATKDFDEAKIKDEIADRTVIELVYAEEEKTLYSVRRTHAGKYEFSLEPKRNP